MSEMKIGHREWVVEVRLDEGEGRDIIKRYTNIKLRPHHVIVTFEAKSGEAPKAHRVMASGRRVLKAGGLGAPVTAEWRMPGALPGWLQRVVEGAHALVLSEAGQS